MIDMSIVFLKFVHSTKTLYDENIESFFIGSLLYAGCDDACPAEPQLGAGGASRLA